MIEFCGAQFSFINMCFTFVFCLFIIWFWAFYMLVLFYMLFCGVLTFLDAVYCLTLEAKFKETQIILLKGLQFCACLY